MLPLSSLLSLLASSLLLVSALLAASLALCRFLLRRRSSPDRLSVAFFHPYCDAGGGGERVLWCAVEALQARFPVPGALTVVIYTGDTGVPPETILAKARSRFGLTVGASSALDLRFVYVRGRHRLEAAAYPRFTMLGQSLGSCLLAWECLRAFTPDVWVDTTGCHFTLPIAKLLGGCRTACYVHYPTITTEMTRAVFERRPSYNNDAAIAGSSAASSAKALYYRAFAWLYWLAGGYADAVLCNSSWTRGHIDALWQLPEVALESGGEGRARARRREGSAGARKRAGSRSRGAAARVTAADAAVAATAASRGSGARPPSHLVFPPCNTDALSQLPLLPAGGRRRVVISVAQFRPEKDHALQLRAFALFRARRGGNGVQLLLVGGCRGPEDEARVASLRVLAQELGLRMPQDVQILVNAPLTELRAALGSAMAGLHTMWNEHFGISVVELMAAGVIAIAHNSAGPRGDIVVPHAGAQTGFLCTTAEEYADALEAVFALTPQQRSSMATAARASTTRFSDEAFADAFYGGLAPVLDAAVDNWRERQGKTKRGRKDARAEGR